jgi:hypothetical protein
MIMPKERKNQHISNIYIWQLHCVWAAAEAYSAPSIVLTSHSHDGLHVFDDFREAYAWLRHNTEVDDKVQPFYKISPKCWLMDFIVFQATSINLYSMAG